MLVGFVLLPPALVAGLVAPQSPPGAHQPTAALSRRALGRGLLAASGLLAAPHSSSALFESPAQLSLSSLATTQAKVQGLIKEVAETNRRRAKMAGDREDDAYVLRFTRSVRHHTRAACERAPTVRGPGHRCSRPCPRR